MNAFLVAIARRATIQVDEHAAEISLRVPLDAFDGLAGLLGRTVPAEGVSRDRDSPPRRETLAAFARYLLACRRRRETLFDGIEIGDPAWDMLLELFVASVDGTRISVSSLGLAAAVPPTTALRWIDAMARDGHLVRDRDQHDGRRSFVSLSADMLCRVEACLCDMREKALALLG